MTTLKQLKTSTDQLGKLRAMIKRLKATEKELKVDMIESGYEFIAGSKYEASIEKITRSRVDWQEIAVKAGATKRLINANTYNDDHYQVKVTEVTNG